jgi:hypothetical protein
MCTMTVATAMPVVKANARAIAMNIFVMLIHRYRSDIMLNSGMLFLRENAYSSFGSRGRGLMLFILPASRRVDL